MALKSILKGIGRSASRSSSGGRDEFGYENARGKKHGGKFSSIHEREYRKEVSRLAAIANKRMARLEKNNLTDSPAYQKLFKNGVTKFGVRGKDFNQVQSEMSKLNNFLNSQTSTIRGINNVLKSVADNTGVKYNTVKELKKNTTAFFNLASQVEQYLRSVEDVASAIGYQKIWEVINEYVESQAGDMENTAKNVDSVKGIVEKILGEVDSSSDIVQLNNNGDFTILL